MKKIFSIILLFVFLLSLCACGTETKVRSAEVISEGTVTLVESNIYNPGGKVSYVARIGNKLLMGGDDNLRLAEYYINDDGTLSFLEASQIAFDGEKILAICAGGDECFYVLAELVYKYSSLGELLETAPYAGNPRGIAVGFDGEIEFYGGDEDNGDTLFSISLCEKGLVGSYFATGFKLMDGTPLEVDTNEVNSYVTQGMNGELIISGSTRFLEVDLETGEIQELLYHGGIENCTGVCRIDEKTFVYTVSGGGGLYVLSVIEKEIGERSVVKVALYAREGMLSQYAAHFSALNATDIEYMYEVEHYDPTMHDRLLIEIASDNAPDLVLFDTALYEFENAQLYTDSDAFDNLYDYIDGDAELSRDSFIPNLLDALSSNGRLTQLWPAVMIITVAARTDDVENKEILTAADYTEMVEKSDKYLSVFDIDQTSRNLLNVVSAVSAAVYIDKENGACSFDDETFVKLLSWCKEVGSNAVIEELTAADAYNPSEVLLLYAAMLDIGTVQYISEYFGEPFTFVGFPTGEYSSGIYCCMGFGMTIPALGSNKAGAWEYIKGTLSASAQLETSALPVNYDAFRHLATASLDSDSYEALMDLLKITKVAESYNDQPIRDLVFSCGIEYLNGSKTLEETVRLIQSRASIYMAEKYG